MRMKFCVLALIASILPLFGQTLGEITGQISDATGATVSAATITAINTATNASRVATSNESGLYSFPSLPPGLYNMRVEKPGFKSTTSSNLEVQVQQTVRMDFTLSVGADFGVDRGSGGRGATASRKFDGGYGHRK